MAKKRAAAAAAVPHLLRNPAVGVVSHRDRYLLIHPESDPICLESEQALTLVPILERTGRPTPKAELLQTGPENAIKMLVSERVLLEGSRNELETLLTGPQNPTRPCRNLVLGVSGAISCTTALMFAQVLTSSFCERLDVILTESAQRFLRTEVFAYRGMNVWLEPFESRDGIKVPHMHLANGAEMILILPASAHTLHKLAHGECSDLLSLVVAATNAPVVLAPSMNPAMRRHAAIARNIAQLRADGMYLIEPSFGEVASKNAGSPLELGALGVNETNIAVTLEAILVTHRREGGVKV